jgi:hypothetical protein
VDLISHEDGRVWSLEIQLESGERMGVELSKVAVLALARSLAEWREWAASSSTGRRDFARRSAK